MKDSQRTELHLAFCWTCDNCGIDNFCRSVTVAVTDEMMAELAENGMDLWGEGSYQTKPKRVVCRECKAAYETDFASED